ncbi:MAG TPA: FAD-binding oxidoreductase [Acidimicrobiales bacterium]|nr:FAD-binding oxidoreductase [Acidimicrobiales bacterium]
MTRQRLTGWGRTAPSVADVVTPDDEAGVVDVLTTSRALIARGLGRSYGDAAQVGGGVVVSNLGLGGIGTIGDDGVVSVGAGVSFDELLATSIPQGWFVPVTPGTRQVTLGGAVAADVHGKNHHVDGSFGAHVRSLRLVTPSGATTVSPEDDPDLFWASVGGMGLTGVITRVSVQMLKIETDRVLVDTERFDNLDAVMSAMVEGDAGYRYSVAWVDCMTRGAHMGRAVLTRADHARAADVATPTLQAPRGARLGVPLDAPSGLLNTLTVRAFNQVWFRSAPRHEVAEAQSLATYFHPLDGVRDWNRLYGRRGFVQYQFCVPDSAADTVVRVITRLADSRVPSFLAVLKRFGAATRGPLSFPAPGWTLALDLPVGPAALPGVLDELDELVIAAGGRVYFAKDARLDPAKVRAMYPRLDEFLEVKKRIDPENRVTSDLARRLGLGGQ